MKYAVSLLIYRKEMQFMQLIIKSELYLLHNSYYVSETAF